MEREKIYNRNDFATSYVQPSFVSLNNSRKSSGSQQTATPSILKKNDVKSDFNSSHQTVSIQNSINKNEPLKTPDSIKNGSFLYLYLSKRK
jgi:hypothetical protein